MFPMENNSMQIQRVKVGLPGHSIQAVKLLNLNLTLSLS
jgi:hypothetical protein